MHWAGNIGGAADYSNLYLFSKKVDVYILFKVTHSATFDKFWEILLTIEDEFIYPLIPVFYAIDELQY